MKKERAKDLDKVILRLPDGMRDRLKKLASKNKMSMNELVVQVLENQFPRPHTLSNRIDELADIVADFRNCIDADEVQYLSQQIFLTLVDIREGKIPIEDEEAIDKVVDVVERWHDRSVDEAAINQLPDYEAGEAADLQGPSLPLLAIQLFEYDAEAMSSFVNAIETGDEAAAHDIISILIQSRKKKQESMPSIDGDLPL
ncbi:MAG: Arc family DNA-binding protein [Roseibium sp.]|uniref:Arc family DNA-binding protein n=1 Tax=Roseibium sp. TaxID=1936156 RepID=UPI00261196C5|nr:Arc family DNA-binding protein [Roseibium sp.]MCV0426226.1 Arc family DNA-binding protein [Roseibium sp.]